MIVHVLYTPGVDGYLRIGALARRTGVSAELLRAWERRYGLLRPARTDGGFRLFSEDDVRRVETMRDHLASGLSAAEAARLSLAAPSADGPVVQRTAAELVERLERFDETGAHTLIDSLLATLTLEAVLRDVVLPALATIGERWERDETTIAQEHFASALLRGRLLALARRWGAGSGPHAILACAPGDLHDLALIAFGLALRNHGWRITYLGPDTPVPTTADTAAELGADVVVVAATLPARLEEAEAELARIAHERRLVLAGPAATRAAADHIGAELLAGDPVEAAAALAASHHAADRRNPPGAG